MSKKKVTQDIEKQIKYLYLDLKYNISEVAKEVNLSFPTVQTYLSKWKIVRGQSEAHFIARDKGARNFYQRRKNAEGYVYHYLEYRDSFRDTPFNYKGKTNRIFEHRYIMAKQLGRLLQDNEIVHHLNGIKDDNRPENLSICFRKNHPSNHTNLTFVKVLQKRIRELEFKLSQQKLI